MCDIQIKNATMSRNRGLAQTLVLSDIYCCHVGFILLLHCLQIFERILYIWAIRHPASGYVQGINDLVTPFFVIFLTEYIIDGMLYYNLIIYCYYNTLISLLPKLLKFIFLFFNRVIICSLFCKRLTQLSFDLYFSFLRLHIFNVCMSFDLSKHYKLS